MKFIDFISSNEGNVLLNWGIEGVHYDAVEGKRVWKEEVAQQYASNPNYRYEQGINCLGWWPLYYGAMRLDDGDYATPVNKEDFYTSADAETQKTLDAYELTCWGDGFDTTGTPTPYGFAWTIAIETGSDAELANSKANALRHTVVPTIVMSKTQEEFNQNFAVFVDRLYNECKIDLWEAAMSEAIISRMEIWGADK